MHQKYLVYSLVLLLCFTLFVSTINFVVDPSAIYLKKIIAEKHAKEFAQKLRNSENGIVQTDWNERLIKTSLAKLAGDVDCAFLGSSRLLQLSTVRNTGGIRNQCNSAVNLSVSGGSMEDLGVFSYILLNNMSMPNQVFIGLDPWTLKVGVDTRYRAYQELYDQMSQLMEQKELGDYESYIVSLIKNLVNGQYLYASLLELNKKFLIPPVQKKELDDTDAGNPDSSATNSLLTKKLRFPEAQYNFEDGYSEALLLNDGSLLYSGPWIKERREHPAGVGGGTYNIYGDIYHQRQIDYLEKIIDLYRYHGTKVSFVLSPYNPQVFKGRDKSHVAYYTKVEALILEIAEALDVKVYGSYFPDAYNCQAVEFFDDIHPSNDCLGRIDFSQ